MSKKSRTSFVGHPSAILFLRISGEGVFQQPRLITPTERGSLGLNMADWRVDNAKWTRGAVLHFQKYARPREDWDHDHCEGCWAKFMESGPSDVLTEGYVTEDNYRWICPGCFRDLKDEMGWKLA